MPNPILRVGPFINSGVFVDQPSSLSAPGNAFPINCANHTSSSRWPWRYYQTTVKNEGTHTGCEEPEPGRTEPTTGGSSTTSNTILTASGNFNKTVIATSNYVPGVEISFSFFYQAAQSFQIKLDFDMEATSNNLAAGSSLSQFQSCFFVDSENNTINGEGDFTHFTCSVTRTLPAAVVPASYSASIDCFVNVGFPDNFCTPNPGSASVSGTLEFKFL